MPQKAEHTIHILEGEATLYQRAGTPHWQVRYKVGGKWLRNTTKEAKLKDAKRVAVDLIGNAKYRERNDLPIVNKRFKSVANLAIKRMNELIGVGQGKPTYKQYIQAINKYLIPYFGRHNIDKIDYVAMMKFQAWRKEKMVKEPSQSAINTHNSAMNRVFDEALMRGYITKLQIPNLENKGVSSDRRPDFTFKEYVQIYRYMRQWVKEARQGYETVARTILRNYILILANTGIRAGTEAMNLKWRHIYYEENEGVGGNKVLTMYIKGKTKERRIPVRHCVARYLQRIQQADAKLKKMTFDEVLEKQIDSYVFRINNKDMTTQYGRMFKRMLIKMDLLKDAVTNKDRTLYSFRHFYATYALTKGNISMSWLCDYMSTSEGMIRKHYKHLNLQILAPHFVGRGELNKQLKYGKDDKKPVEKPKPVPKSSATVIELKKRME